MLPSGAWLLILETAAWLLLAAGAWLLSMEFAGKDMLFRWGAEFWPRSVASLIAILAIIQFLVRYHNLPDAGQSRAEDADRFRLPSASYALRMGATITLPLLYAFLLPRTGYYVLTPFFIAAMMFLFGMRQPRHLVGTTAGIYVAFLLVFSKLLFVPLPTGYWPGFYELNTAFVEILEF